MTDEFAADRDYKLVLHEKAKFARWTALWQSHLFRSGEPGGKCWLAFDGHFNDLTGHV